MAKKTQKIQTINHSESGNHRHIRNKSHTSRQCQNMFIEHMSFRAYSAEYITHLENNREYKVSRISGSDKLCVSVDVDKNSLGPG